MEIILVTGTTFSSRQLSELESPSENQKNEKENLESACWNGMLQELLPELIPGSHGSNEIFLWEIKEGNKIIELEMGQKPGNPDYLLSIDPYTLLSCQRLS